MERPRDTVLTFSQSWSALEALPSELLVYIFSLLPTTRDKVKLRYVSRKIKAISETPSLWNKFSWPWFDKREEKSVNSVLKACGAHVKQLSFPNHMTPSTAVKMMRNFCNVTEVNVGTNLSGDQLERAIERMPCLRKLEICCAVSYKPILLICAKLEELVMHDIHGSVHSSNSPSMYWIESGFKPPQLSVFTGGFSNFVWFAEKWDHWNRQVPAGHNACLRLYDGLKLPLNVLPAAPALQLDFGEAASIPFVKGSDFGLLGFHRDLLLLTDSPCDDGRVVHKAKAVASYEHQVFKSCLYRNVRSLSSVTQLDVSFSNLLSGHLEQIAISCPNLECLRLQNNFDCLKSLQGLQNIVNCCGNLKGLNFLGISVEDAEDHVKFWVLLSELKMLNHLAIGTCFVKPYKEDDESEQKLVKLIQNCCGLQMIQLHVSLDCRVCMDISPLMLCQFPSLVHCNIISGHGSTTPVEIISNCKLLRYFKYSSWSIVDFPAIIPNEHVHLQQLCIHSARSVLSENFMATVSAHGGLEVVVLFVESVTLAGITTLIENSPKLVKFHVYLLLPLRDERRARVVKASLKEKFTHRKLFKLDGFRVKRGKHESEHEILYRTELLPLWTTLDF